MGSHRDFIIYMPSTKGLCLGNCFHYTALLSYQNLPSALICNMCVCVCVFAPLPVCQLCTRNKLHSSVPYPAMTYVQYSKVIAQMLRAHFIPILPDMNGRVCSQLTRCLEKFLFIGVLLHQHLALVSHEF